MFVTETWLNSNVSNTEILPNGYNIYRTDRPLGQTGGGVLIAVKHGIFISCNKVSSLSSANVEVVAIECTLPNHAKWLLVCGYRPPDSNDMSDFRSLADKLFPGYDKIIIAGDFNLPNIYWADSSYTLAGSLSQNFCDILDDYFMSQLCLVPTRESNILDLIITNQPEMVTLTEICSPTDLGMSSDHNIIQFHFSYGCNTIHPNKRLIYNYRQANFEGLRKRLTDMNLCSMLTNNGPECSIDDDWSTWKNSVMYAMNEFVPTKCVDSRRTPPWITGNILHLIRKKVTARKRFLSRGTDYLKEKFNNLRAEVKRLIQESRKSFYSSLGNTLRINPKRFWSVFKISSSSGSVPNSMSRSNPANPETRLFANTPRDISTLFNEYFHSVYTNFSDVCASSQHVSSPPLSCISSLDLSVEEVCQALQNLDATKAHGPDGFPSRILKECAFQLAPSLHYLFTKSLRLSQIPAEWKLANIILLHKKGMKDHVENYRPISLLSIITKTLERCVLNHLSHRIQSTIHSAQYGFVSGKSSTAQLLSTLQTIGKNLDKGLQTDVVFMDISKAFDTVDHAILLQKLRDFGISGPLLLWFENYLSGRFQRVTVLGATSTSLPITSGVPQGSLLAPFLFSLYINDLPNNLNTSTGVGLYADDTKLHRCVQNRNDAVILQEDIQSLHCWSNENRLSFNHSKCKVLSVTRKKSPLIYPYKLGNQQLQFSDVEVDLGITISSKLLWNGQVNKVRSKANQMLGLVRRSTMEITDTNARKLLYLSLVRSNFSYASQAWCPQSVKLIEDIEKVQRRATKYILKLGFVTNVSYTARLLQLDLLPVSYWHEYLDLVFLYKIINHLTYIDQSTLPIIARSGITRSETNNLIRFVIPYAKTVTYQSSYFIRACKTWNVLSSDLRGQNIGLSSFKTGLKSYYKHALSSTFDLDDPRTWKSVCVKCKRGRSLSQAISCC